VTINVTIDSRTIDDIVTGVLRQLGMSSSGVRTEELTPDRLNQTRNGLEVTEPVITEDLLMEKAAGAGHVRIPSAAVITPSGRDWLRKQGVTWERSDRKADSRQSAGWRLIVAAPTDAVDKLNEEVTRWGWTVDCVGGAEEAAVCGVTSLSKEITGVVVLTSEPERVACRANRHQHVRAASVAAVADATRVRQQLGANFVTLCPGGRGFFELRNMMKTIAAGGPPQVPENW
jgi:hypothetical protein